jgi:hypothetical protein
LFKFLDATMTNEISSANTDAGEMLALHTALRDDATGAYAMEIVQTLKHSAEIVGNRMRQRLQPAEFQAAEKLNEALLAAESVVTQVWESMHGEKLQKRN